MGLLHDAAASGDIEYVSALLERGHDVNRRDVNGRAPLHYAARYGHLKVAELLLKHGADVDARDRRGLTPLSYAIMSGNYKVAELLLLRGADPNAKDKRGWSPLHHAVKKIDVKTPQLLLGEPAPLKFFALLLERGADPNARTRDGLTPLHIAARYNRVVLAKMLLDAGADPNSPDARGWTPLHYAIRHGSAELAELLLKHGANPGARDHRGRTPFELRPSIRISPEWRRLGRLSRVLAREAFFRSRREMGEAAAPPFSGDVVTLLLSIALVFLSLILGLLMAYFSAEDPMLPAFTLLILFLISLFPGLTQMALNANVVISDKLVEPLRHLPLDWSELYGVIVMQSFLWGGFLPLLAFIPAALVYLAIRRNITVPLGFALAGIFAALLVISLGYLAGLFGGRYTRSISRRAVSTAVWILALSSGYILGGATKWFGWLLESAWAAAIPPICFLYVTREPLSLASSVVSLAAVVMLSRLSIPKFLRAAATAEVFAPPPQRLWSLGTQWFSPVLKELKMVVRAPRILSQIIVYTLLFPILNFEALLRYSPGIAETWLMFEDPPLDRLALLMVSLAIFQAIPGSYLMFIAEGANAKSLYLLPLTRLKVALSKSASIILMYSPILVTISVVSAISLHHLLGLIYALAFPGLTLISSLLLARWAPREPSHWSRETYNLVKYIIVWLAVLSPLSIPFALFMIRILHPVFYCEILQPLAASVFSRNFVFAYLLALYAGSMILAVKMREDPV